MDLKNLMVDRKAAWVPFSGISDFEVQVVNLSRKELSKLRKRCTTTKFDKRTRQPVDTVDEDQFVKEFARATVKDWKGLTLSKLEDLIIVDTDGKDLEMEIPYSEENAEILVSSSTEFDTWLNEVVFDLDNFRTKSD